MIVSGGADSVITFWEDVTVTEELERIAQHENTVLKYVLSLQCPDIAMVNVERTEC